VLLVVEAQTPHRLDVLSGQRGEQQAHVGDLVRHLVLAKDVARDDAGLARLGDVGLAGGQQRVAVVDAAVPGQEADEALGPLISPNSRTREGEAERLRRRRALQLRGR
jgi:hypothetical protein